MARSSNSEKAVLEDASKFVRAFGDHATFTVRFISQDKKSGEKLQCMNTEDLVGQLPALLLLFWE